MFTDTIERFSAAALVVLLPVVAGGCLRFDESNALENEPLPEVNLEDARIVEQPRGPVAEGQEAIVTADQVFAERDHVSEEITVRGAVLGKRHVKLKGDHTGVVIELQPGGDFIDVLIGTTRFNESQSVDVGIADRVMVTGPVVETEDGARMLIARELVWQDRTIELRDADGHPKWEE